LQVQKLGLDFEIVSVRAWDEQLGVEFNVYPWRRRGFFAASSSKLYVEVVVRNNTTEWQGVYVEVTAGGITIRYALAVGPSKTASLKSYRSIDFALGWWTIKLYRGDTVYQTVSFYAFSVWGGNHHLPGDVNFDGFINMADLDLVKAQLGRTSDDVWGTEPHQYDPNRDLDGDGVISERDLRVVKKLLGKWCEWSCLTHPNPSMINNGAGWTITNCGMAGECFGITENETTFYKDRRGFRHTCKYETYLVGAGGYTEVDFTPDGHYAHDPENWNRVKPGDIPLTELSDYKFIIEGAVHEWWRGYFHHLSYMGWCFGGFVLTAKPIRYYGCMIPLKMGGAEGYEPPHYPPHLLSEINVLELMFWIKQHRDGQDLTPGGDEWHRIFYRKGFGRLTLVENGWFICGYICGDPEVGQTVRAELTGEKILQLLKTLEGKDIIFQKNPLFPNQYSVWGYHDFFMKGLDLRGHILDLSTIP